MKVKKIIYVVLGCICLALGTVGVVVPILPTVPFYMATLFFFSRSSQRLNDWFVGTELYKKHLKSFKEGKGMLMKTKVSILTTVTLLMGFGFFMMKSVPVARAILAAVWIVHVLYFVFGVRTLKPGEAEDSSNIADSTSSENIE